MAFERVDASPLNYNQCRYGQSKLLFRGPRRSLKSDYISFVGSSETYGKFVKMPFVELVEEAIGIPCANFSAMNAGVDAFVHDPSLLSLFNRSKTTVIQVMGAQNMSNRFYSVHARRNDRFLKASTLLRSIYREVDFSEFSFTRHLLTTLKAVSPQRFAAIEMELRSAWLARMELMLRQINGRCILLWLREPQSEIFSAADLGPDPLFLDAPLVGRLQGMVDEIVEVDIAHERGVLDGMVYSAMEAPVAQQMIGPATHRKIADRLLKVL
ncbi:hypothetical protein BDE40_2218 [Litoreibacter halocynthiae]|uniref:DUF6473 domain-containing protein n=1 Tax=Litoreibacter halocynthiae TaxID=1242689 RepID=A0A4R7LLA1_9RHOB|nr:DUF6473 family protein [Litoreibacter halocynthiae]TDT75486.1 hypothetical protein BDE40_2218 [Litoreibacter halocynthiae]